MKTVSEHFVIDYFCLFYFSSLSESHIFVDFVLTLEPNLDLKCTNYIFEVNLVTSLTHL